MRRTVNATQDKPTAILVTAPEAAAILAISERKLWSLKKLGEIPHVKIDRSVRYKRTDLLAWIDAKTKGGIAPIDSEANSTDLEA